jgi:lipoate-protein ligase B
LNYETDLNYFDLIHPCGLVGKKMTSMTEILGRKIFRGDLVGRVVSHFKEVFEREWEEKKLEELIPENRMQKAEGTEPVANP